jgi:hypothetical protein
VGGIETVNAPARAAYRDLRSLTLAVNLSLAACTLMAPFTMALSATELFVLPDWESLAGVGDPRGLAVATMFGLIGLSTLGAHFVATILFCLWIHRAVLNTHALGAPTRHFTAAAAVYWWFVPFVNLFKPYQAVRELHYQSAPDEPGQSTWPRRFPALFPLWWGAWLLSNMTGNIALPASFSDDPAEHHSALWVNLVGGPFEILAGLVAIAIVHSIGVRQEDRAREQGLA